VLRGPERPPLPDDEPLPASLNARVGVLIAAFLAACGGAGGATDAPSGDAGRSLDGATGAASPVDTGPADASSGGDSSGGSIGDSGARADADAGGSSKPPPSARVFGAYKDTSINLNWNTNVVSASASGTAVSLASDLAANGGHAVTLAFATGECGNEEWAGVAGDTLASTNAPLLAQAGVQYVVSTGGAAGSFTCATDSGFATFVGRWASSGLVGIDFDIEAGQSTAQIGDLVQRIKTAHGTYPDLRFSLTLATLANNAGAPAAASLGASVDDSFNTYGDQVMAAVKSTLGFSGVAATWPAYLTVDLMTMDYGAPSAGVCVVAGGACQMGQSAIQAAYNLHDRWGVPYGNIELTPMIGQNDQSSEHFTLSDVDTLSAFVIQMGLSGVHSWSYDRDVDCPAGSASSTCSSMGNGYAGDRGYLKRFLADGL
jgi:chitinase